MKARAILLSCLIAVALVSTTQASEEYQQWLENQRKSFDSYLSEMDAEFSKMLGHRWKSAEVVQEIQKKNKPEQLPTVVEKHPKTIETIAALEISLPQFKPEKISITAPGSNLVEFDFYGLQTEFSTELRVEQSLRRPLNEKNISEYWEHLARKSASGLLEQARKIQRQYYFNDWDLSIFLYRLAGTYTSNSNEQRILTWYWLNKAGYKSRIAFNKQQVVLLLGTRQNLYDTKYLTINRQRYYIPNFSMEGESTPTKLTTYKTDYPLANEQIGLQWQRKLNLGGQWKTRSVSFEYKTKRYHINFPLNTNLVTHLKDYPQIPFQNLFQTPLSETVFETLKIQIDPLMDGMSEVQKVSFLLALVQKGFPYQVDDEQFGYENYLYPHEMFFYPYSDCEDRSLLYARLVRELISLPVVALDYPGHVATAVALSRNLEGKSIIYRNIKYWMADPSYINAPVGLEMKHLVRIQPKIIVVD